MVIYVQSILVALLNKISQRTGVSPCWYVLHVEIHVCFLEFPKSIANQHMSPIQNGNLTDLTNCKYHINHKTCSWLSFKQKSEIHQIFPEIHGWNLCEVSCLCIRLSPRQGFQNVEIFWGGTALEAAHSTKQWGKKNKKIGHLTQEIWFDHEKLRKWPKTMGI